jgi:uncharacterized protein GlcG (DUF336 family)
MTGATQALAMLLFSAATLPPVGSAPAVANADRGGASCAGLPDWSALKAALEQAVAAETSGLDNQMWATIVDRDGIVCAVAFSGADRGAQWPGSRVISAQKANTANAFSLDGSSRGGSPPSGQANGLALSTANLYTATQPGQSLYGLQHSNPVDEDAAYRGPASLHGTKNDPMVGRRIGGVNVFGGGLGLYTLAEGRHVIVGGLGVSGDTSCADHNIAYRVRHALDLDHLRATESLAAVPGPASLFAGDAAHPDNIIFDIGPGGSASGFGHATCLNTAGSNALPAVQP